TARCVNAYLAELIFERASFRDFAHLWFGLSRRFVSDNTINRIAQGGNVPGHKCKLYSAQSPVLESPSLQKLTRYNFSIAVHHVETLDPFLGEANIAFRNVAAKPAQCIKHDERHSLSPRIDPCEDITKSRLDHFFPEPLRKIVAPDRVGIN